MSEPENNKKYLKRLKEEECRLIYSKQFEKLKYYILKVKKENRFITNNSYKKGLTEFQQFLLDGLQKNYKNIQFSNQTFDFDIVVKIQKMGFVEGTFYAFKNAVSNMKYLLKYTLIFAPIVFVIGPPIVGIVGLYKQEIKKKEQLQSLINDKVKGIIVNIIQNTMTIDDQKCLIFPIKDYLKIVSAVHNQTPLYLQQENANFTKIELQVGENTITLMSKLPSYSYMEKFISQASQRFFNNKQ